ncbi:hypothetical protein TRVL_05703 [Trypanosoma vivax]|nr:hypothetical protein TRVL_05703 [Trypanosoma vivax]
MLHFLNTPFLNVSRLLHSPDRPPPFCQVPLRSSFCCPWLLITPHVPHRVCNTSIGAVFILLSGPNPPNRVKCVLPVQHRPTLSFCPAAHLSVHHFLPPSSSHARVSLSFRFVFLPPLRILRVPTPCSVAAPRFAVGPGSPFSHRCLLLFLVNPHALLPLLPLVPRHIASSWHRFHSALSDDPCPTPASRSTPTVLRSSGAARKGTGAKSVTRALRSVALRPHTPLSPQHACSKSFLEFPQK